MSSSGWHKKPQQLPTGTLGVLHATDHMGEGWSVGDVCVVERADENADRFGDVPLWRCLRSGEVSSWSSSRFRPIPENQP